MANKKMSEEVRTRIKLQRLNKHLEEVEELCEQWRKELVTLAPFDRKSLLDTASNNHMLRRHLRSRALWGYYPKLQEKRDRMKELAEVLHRKAREAGVSRQTLILEEAFSRICVVGFSPVQTGADRAVLKENEEAIVKLARLDEMKQLRDEWKEARAIGEKMHGLIWKAVKSSDILYRCQFCRRLWEDN